MKHGKRAQKNIKKCQEQVRKILQIRLFTISNVISSLAVRKKLLFHQKNQFDA